MHIMSWKTSSLYHGSKYLVRPSSISLNLLRSFALYRELYLQLLN